jgi:hypothetical protein
MAYGSLMHTEMDSQGITYELFVDYDELQVRGNAMASDDDDEDKAVEDEIIERLESGDVWAWAAVTCRASYKGLIGQDHLGACSYKDTEDFIAPGGYWDDMKSEAKTDLLRNAKASSEALANLEAEVTQ